MNGNRCQLPTSPSICMLPGVLPDGCSVEDEEFSLNGITEMTGVDDDETPALLHNLPKSLRKLTFSHMALIRDFMM